MTLTKSASATIAERIRSDHAFTVALIDEAATLMLNGEPETARIMLREVVNASVGFESLAKEAGIPSKSLHRMLTAGGNPTMENLSKIFSTLRARFGINFHVSSSQPA